MSDSNEMKKDQNHPRLRLPQAGVKAQEEYDAGEPLTTVSMAERINNIHLDFMNGRVAREDVHAHVAIANSMAKMMALELKNRELILYYAYKHEQVIETPEPLQLVAGKQKGTKRRAVG